MLFKSALLTQASGSVGGITFSRNRGGMYIRSRTIPTDPATAFQLVIRDAMALLVVRWNDTLTEANRVAWRLYAERVTLTNPLGDPINVSGLNMYVRSNVPRIQNLDPIIDSAPTIFNLGTLSAMLSLGASEGTQQISISFDVTDGWNVAGGRLYIYISRPENTGVIFNKGPYRISGRLVGDGPATSPVLVNVPFPITLGQNIWVKSHASYADGRYTTPVFIAEVPVVV